MGTGRFSDDGEELEIYLDLFTASASASTFAQRFPGSRVKKMIASSDGAVEIKGSPKSKN